MTALVRDTYVEIYSLLYRFISEGSSKLMPIIKVVVALVVCNLLLNFLFVFGVGNISGRR
jgi:MATE family multidrug resistance protein